MVYPMWEGSVTVIHMGSLTSKHGPWKNCDIPLWPQSLPGLLYSFTLFLSRMIYST